MYRLYLKRLLDFCFSLLGLILLSIPILILIIVMTIANGGKPFFVQKRPGKKGRVFKLIKFKTMRDFEGGNSDDLHSPKRVTKIGGFIRKYSLDEVLQLINVLKGDMSIVGPRPLLVEYLPLYNQTQKRRHDVKPGITGWAQVNGRNTISWETKFDYDLWYVNNISFKTDLIIIFKTIQKVIKKEDISASEEITMKPFRGSPST
ncbi:sugar transferase [Flagellimonas sp. 2504JD1-5]